MTRARDGKACLSLAGFPSTEKGSEGEPQIIAVTPEGYYGGHPTADNLIRFNLGGYLFPAASFVDRYRRPDLIRKAFHGDETPALKATKGGIPPMAVFSFPESGASVSGEKVQVSVVATDDTGLAGVFFTVNGARIGEKPEDALGTTRDLSLLAEKIGHPIPPQHTVSKRYTANLTLPPNSGKVTIQAVVIDTDGLRSTPAELTVTRTQGRIVTERLLGLCVGVSKYKVPGLNLSFADADARELAASLDKQQSALYKERHFTTLVNEKATKSEIIAELDRLIERTEKSDTVCVFLAGHGWRHRDDQRGQRRLAPQCKVGQRAPGKVARADPDADIATRKTHTCQRVKAHSCTPVARHRQHAAPRMVNRDTRRCWKMPVQNGRQTPDRFRIRRAIAVNLRSVQIRHPSRADRNAPLARALAIAIGIRKIANNFMPFPADLRPDLGRQRGGDNLC